MLKVFSWVLKIIGLVEEARKPTSYEDYKSMGYTDEYIEAINPLVALKEKESKRPKAEDPDYNPWKALLYEFNNEIESIKRTEDTLGKEHAVEERQELERSMHKFIDEAIEHAKKQQPLNTVIIGFYLDLRNRVTEYISGDLTNQEYEPDSETP